jgi:hypothetical protein
MQYEGVLKKNANQFGINSILFGFDDSFLNVNQLLDKKYSD